MSSRNTGTPIPVRCRDAVDLDRLDLTNEARFRTEARNSRRSLPAVLPGPDCQASARWAARAGCGLNAPDKLVKGWA